MGVHRDAFKTMPQASGQSAINTNVASLTSTPTIRSEPCRKRAVTLSIPTVPTTSQNIWSSITDRRRRKCGGGIAETFGQQRTEGPSVLSKTTKPRQSASSSPTCGANTSGPWRCRFITTPIFGHDPSRGTSKTMPQAIRLASARRRQ
jgi:hypothetical protein